MKQQMTPIEPDENTICAPCWLEARRDVKARVVLQQDEPDRHHSSRTFLCGHHAELVELDEEERLVR